MTSQLDKVFEHELDVIQSLKGTLSKKDKIHFCKWISRLQYICRTKHERTIRNRYLELLSLQVQLLGHLEEPFTRIPPEGNLEPIPSYWLERLQKTRVGLSRARSPQAIVHDRTGIPSPQFSYIGMGQHAHPNPHQFGDHRHVSFDEDNAYPDGYAYISSALSGNLPSSSTHTEYKYYPSRGQQPSEFPLSSSKGPSFVSQSLADESVNTITVAARRDTPTFDTVKTARRIRHDTPDNNSMRDSFPDVQYLQPTRPPIDDSLSNRMNSLLQHEIQVHLQANNQIESHTPQPPNILTNEIDDANAYNISIAELRAVPESIPNMTANIHKLVASVIDSSSATYQIDTLSKSCSGIPRITEQSLSVENIRCRRVLTASRVDNNIDRSFEKEQRYIVAATIEAPISTHTSRSGTAMSIRSARGSDGIVDPPIMTASQRDLQDRPITTLTEHDSDCHITTMNVLHTSQTILEPSEARPALSPRRSNVSYVTSEVHAEPLPVESRSNSIAESVSYKTEKDYTVIEPNSVVHNSNKEVIDLIDMSNMLMSAASTSISTNAVIDTNSMVSPGIKTLIVKPHTSSSVPELTAVQIIGISQIQTVEPPVVTSLSPKQDNGKTENESIPTILRAQPDTPGIDNTTLEAKIAEDEVLTVVAETSKADIQTIYLEGSHQDDRLIKPVKADFIPHVIPTSSPRSSDYNSIIPLNNGDISPARSLTCSPDSRAKKPRVRLLPTGTQEPAQKVELNVLSVPELQVEQTNSIITDPSPRRIAGQTLYSDLLSSRMESLTSSISQSMLESKGPNPDLIMQPPIIKQNLELTEKLMVQKDRIGSSFVAPDLADAEDNIDRSLYFVITDKRGQDVLSPDTVTCETAGRRLINSKPPDDDEAAMSAIMSACKPFGQRTFKEHNTSSDFDEPEPPMIVCDTGDAPPVVIKAGVIAPPMSFEENIAILQSAKQDGCISYSRSRAGSRAFSLSRRSTSVSRYSEAPILQNQYHCK